MHIDNRLLALLTAATLGTALIGCQRESADERASKEGTPPLAAAPSDSAAPSSSPYSAPSGIEGPAGTTTEKEKIGQPGDQTGKKMNEPGDMGQEKTQR